MTVSIDIGVGRKERALTIPAEAVRESGNSPTVQVVREGIARSVKVEIGIRTNSRCEILSGITESDSVILTRGIDDGVRVHALEVRR